MSNTYTWAIAYMDTKLSVDELTNVVISCQWTCSATTGGDTPTTDSSYGYAHFGAPSAEDYTAYSDLTHEQVLNWVWASGVDKVASEAGLDASIGQKLNPPSVILANPWN